MFVRIRRSRRIVLGHFRTIVTHLIHRVRLKDSSRYNMSVQLTLGEMAFVERIGIGSSISRRTWKSGGSRS